ncbi:MAG TPA: prepilin-type N-terminal cleavage/methylation domain-containing protein [Lacipirellulaceae bacterium]|nr:prepilin-type N-terminal cleavage/methylation domain-containing protein [Lacipirellulaceae bacterium]
MLRRRGFTLTELLVVIAIIGVLAALITAAAINALRNARQARIVLEIKNMSTAIENFKSDFGAYPPNAMNNATAAMTRRIIPDFERMAKKAFPQIDPAELDVFRALASTNYSTAIVTDSTVRGGMSAAEALYFWLGGFSSDPKYPLSGPGGPSFLVSDGEVLENRQRRYEFPLEQLGPKTDGELDDTLVRYVEYTITVNGTAQQRRINLWTYAPAGSTKAYVYFDASRYKPGQYDMPAYDASDFPDEAVIFPVAQLRTGLKEATGATADLVFANNRKFQILHAGLDDAWGENFAALGQQPNVSDSTDVITFPEGPFLGEVADTLSNFTDGAIADSQEE